MLRVAQASETGESVVLVYNAAVPESKTVAEHYAQRRGVPANQLFGLDLPTGAEMTRLEYLERFQTPLLEKLEATGLFVFGERKTATEDPTQGWRSLTSSKIRYAVLCYGVPIKIRKDEKLVEEEAATLQAELQRTEASVDSQLACLPLAAQRRLIWAGPISNPLYGTTNVSWMHPTNGLLMVSRLDGPTPEIARRLVDLALEAETNGFWGRAYFDTRGITNGAFALGDEWMRTGERICRQYGFETVIDAREQTFTRGFPLSDVALYVGWYDWHVSGPFLQPKIDFMPGAFAYHLHSFSADTIRSKDANWVGPLLDRGAAATVGNVYEPYLSGTLDLPVFFSRWFFHKSSYGEAAWAALSACSWQTLVVGDPLYRPFIRGEQQLHQDLEQKQNKLVEWSHLLIVNRNLAMNTPVAALIDYLEKFPITKNSAVLTEKLSQLYRSKSQYSFAIYSAEDALKRDPTPLQKLRILLWLAHLRSYYGPDDKAIDCYQRVLSEYPEYPDGDRLDVYQKMLPLARNKKNKELIATCEREIKRLTPPATPPKG